MVGCSIRLSLILLAPFIIICEPFHLFEKYLFLNIASLTLYWKCHSVQNLFLKEALKPEIPFQGIYVSLGFDSFAMEYGIFSIS